jgi:hypothetical protein
MMPSSQAVWSAGPSVLNCRDQTSDYKPADIPQEAFIAALKVDS